MWLIQFENLMTSEEAKQMIELGHIKGYERSADVGELNEDGTVGDSNVNDGRTSANAVR